jgi:hypothetical protein
MSNLEAMPERKKLSQYILGNARTLMIVFILFTVVVVMTTDIKLVTISSITDLGLEFFILLFASYGMYISCTDEGISKGYANEAYKKAVGNFEELKEQIVESWLARMNEFCAYYVDEELRKTRMQYLSVVCIPYDEYIERYVNLGKNDIKEIRYLKDSQKKAIIKANKVSRIKLTPEMIMTLGKTVHSRSALSISPDTLKSITIGKKIVKMSAISICMSMVALDIIMQPSWTVFSEVCLKLATVVINGFDGYREGFNNITTHTVNYVNNQSSLMHQAIQYCKAHPALAIEAHHPTNE